MRETWFPQLTTRAFPAGSEQWAHILTSSIKKLRSLLLHPPCSLQWHPPHTHPKVSEGGYNGKLKVPMRPHINGTLTSEKMMK